MQELLLFGQALARDHDQLLKMLSLYAAMKPKRIIERHMIFKAKRPTVNIPNTESQPALQPLVARLNSSLYSIHLVRNVTKDFLGKSHDDPLTNEEAVNGASKGAEDTDPRGQAALEFPPPLKLPHWSEPEWSEQDWSVEFRDTPIAGGKGIVTQRARLSTKIRIDELLVFLGLWGFEHVTEHIQEGHMLHHGHVNLWLYRMREFPSHEQDKSPYGGASLQDLPSWDQCSLFESAGNYMLQASVNLSGEITPDLVNQGTEELVTFQKDFKSVVSMAPVPHRLALDTRVK